MKKILSVLLSLILLAIITGGIFVFLRYNKNPEQIVPYPYTFQTPAPDIPHEAPILIVGDRMAEYLAKFSNHLANTISYNLDNAIKVQTIARKGYGIHRTLHQLRSLKQWPQILVYQGGSEEFSENKFNLFEINKIRTNFSRYSDDRIETMLILYPWLSRIVYEPIERMVFTEEPIAFEYEQKNYLRRLETELLLYRQHLIQLVSMARDRNSLLILSTTPINMDIAPKVVCDFATTTTIEAEILTLRDLIAAKNPKSAYALVTKLSAQNPTNAEILYLHGQVARRLGKSSEAKSKFLESTAYDCLPWRATELQNSIIRKVAQDHQVPLFDFAALLEQNFDNGVTFFDEHYPQNLYYEQGMEQLGLVIRKILKL